MTQSTKRTPVVSYLLMAVGAFLAVALSLAPSIARGADGSKAKPGVKCVNCTCEDNCQCKPGVGCPANLVYNAIDAEGGTPFNSITWKDVQLVAQENASAGKVGGKTKVESVVVSYLSFAKDSNPTFYLNGKKATPAEVQAWAAVRVDTYVQLTDDALYFSGGRVSSAQTAASAPPVSRPTVSLSAPYYAPQSCPNGRCPNAPKF